jgi:anti-sigma factor RsiW
MSRTDESSDRALWQRSRVTDAPDDDAARFLDLAGFVDGLLDTDERERVADLVTAEPTAAADVVAAAQAPAGGVDERPAGFERIVARACALVPNPHLTGARVIAFPPRPRHHRLLHGLAQWGSLAAAILVASWLGFSMGSDTSFALSPPGLSNDTSAIPELFDPGTGFLRDFGENLRS